MLPTCYAAENNHQCFDTFGWVPGTTSVIGRKNVCTFQTCSETSAYLQHGGK